MPYIEAEARKHVESGLPPRNAGELNYAITRLCGLYASASGRSYATFNEVVGVLECAKQEFSRRVIAVYEDEKRIDNGDVYPLAIQDPMFNDLEDTPSLTLTYDHQTGKWVH